MKKQTKIDWPKVWAAFNKWHDSLGPMYAMDWKKQQRKIQSLVNAQLRNRRGQTT